MSEEKGRREGGRRKEAETCWRTTEKATGGWVERRRENNGARVVSLLPGGAAGAGRNARETTQHGRPGGRAPSAQYSTAPVVR